MAAADYAHSRTSDISEDEGSSPPPSDYEPSTGGMISYSYLDREDLENITQYCKGGYHPVHIGDILNDRFEVVNKLGSGGFGIVWLCLDTKFNKWGAVKIMTADHSTKESDRDAKIIEHLKSQASLEELRENGITIPLEEFWIDGPHGSHHCSVMPVLGCSVQAWRRKLHWTEFVSGNKARAMCQEVVKSLDFLHKHGICHGDFRPANILLRVEGFEDLDRSEVNRIFGEPELRKLGRTYPGSETWPEYCVLPVSEYNSKWVDLAIPKVAIIDYGESFFINEPRKFCGIPKLYAAPELFFDSRPSVNSDIWALVCTLYRIRASRKIFNINGWGTNEMCDLASEWEIPLGPLPEPYRTVWYQKGYGKDDYEDDETDTEEEGNANNDKSPPTEIKDGPVTYDTVEQIMQVREEMKSEAGVETIFQAIVGDEKHIAQREPDETSDRDSKAVPYHEYRYSGKEIVDLADLLERAFKWEPTERISLNEILCHPWLKQ